MSSLSFDTGPLDRSLDEDNYVFLDAQSADAKFDANVIKVKVTKEDATFNLRPIQ